MIFIWIILLVMNGIVVVHVGRNLKHFGNPGAILFLVLLIGFVFVLSAIAKPIIALVKEIVADIKQ